MKLAVLRATRGFLFVAGIVIGASISWTLTQGRRDARNRAAAERWQRGPASKPTGRDLDLLKERLASRRR